VLSWLLLFAVEFVKFQVELDLVKALEPEATRCEGAFEGCHCGSGSMAEPSACD
jgi:hypothetical protein